MVFGAGIHATAGLWGPLILALILAALTFVPPVTQAEGQLMPRVEILWWPLIGAVVGYFIKR